MQASLSLNAVINVDLKLLSNVLVTLINVKM